MKAKKFMALLLACCLLVLSFAACGGNENNSDASSANNSTASTDGDTPGGDEGETGATDGPEALTLPLSEDGAELSVFCSYSGTIVSDLNDIAGVKKMEELTGVHINWTPVNIDEQSDKYGILIASGSYPDIVYSSNMYPGGTETGIADGVIYEDHDTLIHKYMPNYLAYLESNENARREATADSGKMLAVKCIVGKDYTVESEGSYLGLAYRKDLLDDLNIAEPTTIDEWHDALVAAKESGIQYPLMIETTGFSPLSWAYGVTLGMPSSNFIQLEGDTVVGSALKEGFGQYLETMRQWYSEGLIDPNFTSFNYYLDTPGSVENNEKLLYSSVLSAFSGGNYANMHMISNESAYLQPVTAPVLNKGDDPIQCGDRAYAGDTMFISTSCKDPVLAAKWLDFQYSKEGELLSWYGIEGETYELDSDGYPQYLDSVFNNSDGLSPADYLQKFARNMGNCWMGKNNWEANMKLTTATSGGTNQQAAAVDIWSAPAVNIAYPTRLVTPTAEETELISVKSTSVNTMAQEYMINYIMGTDNTPVEEIQQQLLDIGYQDVIDAYQAAYDRYLAR